MEGRGRTGTRSSGAKRYRAVRATGTIRRLCSHAFQMAHNHGKAGGLAVGKLKKSESVFSRCFGGFLKISWFREINFQGRDAARTIFSKKEIFRRNTVMLFNNRNCRSANQR